MRSLQVSCAFILLTGLFAFQPMPLLKIEASGNTLVQTEEIIRVSGLQAGQSVTREQIQAAAERLMASGRFERVAYRWKPEEGGIVLTFLVREREAAPAPETAPATAAPKGPRIRDVVFEGNAAVSGDRLRAALAGIVEDRLYEDPDFRQTLENLLRPLYVEQGYWSVRFTPAAEVEGAAARVRVRVEEGPQLRLADVSLEGGGRRWLDQAKFPLGEVAARKAIQSALARLRNAVESEGYLRAGIIAREVVEADALKLVVAVDVGTRFVFGALVLSGLDAEDETRARKLWRMRKGDPMNPQAVEDFIRAVFAARIPKGTGASRELKTDPDGPAVEVRITFR